MKRWQWETTWIWTAPPDIGNQKPGFSLAKAFLVLQNARKEAMCLVQTAKNLVSLPVSGSEIVEHGLHDWGKVCL